MFRTEIGLLKSSEVTVFFPEGGQRTLFLPLFFLTSFGIIWNRASSVSIVVHASTVCTSVLIQHYIGQILLHQLVLIAGDEYLSLITAGSLGLHSYVLRNHCNCNQRPIIFEDGHPCGWNTLIMC